MALSLLEEAIQRNRAQLLAGDANALAAMRNAYMPVRSRLNTLIDELVKVLESSGELTGGQAMKLERAQILIQQVEEELTRFGAGADGFIQSAQRQAIQLATAHVQSTIFAQDPSLALSFNRVNTRAVENLVGRMSDGSPLRSWLDALGPDTAAKMERSILDGLALGQNPRAVAREIQAALAKDVDLAGYRILNHTRTQMLGAYRGATLERYRENSDFIDEWEWLSAKQARTCRACLGLDGRRFPLTVTFQASHNSCRCSSIPVLPGVKIDRELGKDWLAKQDEKTQDGILGKEGGKEYRAGNVALDDFVALHKDKRWGDSYRAGSLEHAQASAKARLAAEKPKATRAPKAKQPVISDKARKIVTEEHEDFIRRLDYESSGAYDPVTGDTIYLVDGNAYGINIPDDKIRASKDMISSHNHPSGWNFPKGDPRRVGHSFSGSDWTFAAQADVLQLRAVTPANRWVATRPAKGWPTRDEMEKAVYEAEQEVRQQQWPKIKSGKLKPEDAEMLEQEKMARIIAKRFGIKLEKIEDPHPDF